MADNLMRQGAAQPLNNNRFLPSTRPTNKHQKKKQAYLDITPSKCKPQPLQVTTTGAALLDNNETTAKSTSQDGGMAGNFG